MGYRIRRFPYPYRAMTAFESDIDSTTLLRFRETHRFLNTHVETSLGPGLGMDFANSFWCYRSAPSPSRYLETRDIGYWSGLDDPQPTWYADEIAAYARAGRFGALHSFGRCGRDFTRAHAEQALEMLERENIAFKIWSNHGHIHHQNIATDLDQRDDRFGSNPESPCYHSDLLRQYGVRFFWTGGVNSTNEGTTEPLHAATMLDGARVWVFERNNSLYHDAADLDLLLRKNAVFSARARWAASIIWQAYLLEFALGQARLNRLMQHGLFCIYGQHLGNQLGVANFTPGAAAGLRRLKQHHDRGQILVSSTERLLRYVVASKYAKLSLATLDDKHVIDIRSIRDPVYGPFEPTLEDVRGLSIEIDVRQKDAAKPCVILLNGRAIDDAETFSIETREGLVAGVRWHEVDTTDYTEAFEAQDEQRLYYRLHCEKDRAAIRPKGGAKRRKNGEAEADAPAPARTAPTIFGLDAADRLFVLNEAGFAGVDGAMAIGDDAGAWADGLRALGRRNWAIATPAAEGRAGLVDALTKELKATARGAASRVAIMSAPVADLGLSGSLALLHDALPRGTTRLLHCVTGATLLRRIATQSGKRRLAAADAALEHLAESELRRMAPASALDAPAIVHDRAEVERSIVLAGLQNYGAVPNGRGLAPDMIGARDLCFMTAPGGHLAGRSLARICQFCESTGEGADYLLRLLDFAIEVAGAEVAEPLLTPESRAVLGAHAVEVRAACIAYARARASGNGEMTEATAAIDRIVQSKAEFLTAEERALIARVVFHERGPDEIAALTAPMASAPECLTVLGWSHYRADAYEAAIDAFRHAAEWAPAEQSAITGLLAAERKLGRKTLSWNVLERHLEEANRAAIEEMALVDWPSERPRDQTDWN